MVFRTLMLRTFLFPAVLCFITPCSWAGATEFVPGKVADLRCRVVKTKSLARKPEKLTHGCVLTIEVRNLGAVAAEPLVFRLTVKKAADGKTPPPLEVPRFKGPVFGRAGRGVKPGATLRYRVMAPLYLKSRAGVTAEVTRASFFTGEPVDQLDVKVTGRRTDRWQVGPGFSADLTSYRVKNPLSHPVDLAFLGRVEAPIAGEAIFQKRLGPGEEVRWEIRGVYFANGQGFEGANVGRLKLIDWSVVKDDGRDRARRLFAAAYGKWRRWKKNLAVTGRYDYQGRQVPVKEATGGRGFDYRSRGGFTLAADGRVSVVPDEAGSRAAGAVRSAILAAFADLRRPPVDEVLAANKLTLVEVGERPRIGIDGPRWTPGPEPAGFLELAGGRIEAEGIPGSVLRTVWLTRPSGEGWVVGGRDAYQQLTGATPWSSERVTYDETGRLFAPRSYCRRRFLTGVYTEQVRIIFADVRPATEAEAAPIVDTGPAAAAVRAAWDACYRYPEAPATLAGAFVVRNDGRTEALWQGEKKVSGSFVIRGWRGGTYADAKVDVKEKMPPLKRDELGALVMDRFRIWFFRDFAARKSFARTFAGATFTAEKNGVFQVKDGPYAAVEVKDGRIHALVYRGGTRRRIDYERIGDRWVAAGVTTGDEVCRAKFKAVGDRLVPVDMRFSRVFGRDWGPESVSLRAVTVSP